MMNDQSRPHCVAIVCANNIKKVECNNFRTQTPTELAISFIVILVQHHRVQHFSMCVCFIFYYFMFFRRHRRRSCAPNLLDRQTYKLEKWREIEATKKKERTRISAGVSPGSSFSLQSLVAGYRKTQRHTPFCIGMAKCKQTKNRHKESGIILFKKKQTARKERRKGKKKKVVEVCLATFNQISVVFFNCLFV